MGDRVLRRWSGYCAQILFDYEKLLAYRVLRRRGEYSGDKVKKYDDFYTYRLLRHIRGDSSHMARRTMKLGQLIP